jgi:hypothetical protein
MADEAPQAPAVTDVPAAAPAAEQPQMAAPVPSAEAAIAPAAAPIPEAKPTLLQEAVKAVEEKAAPAAEAKPAEPKVEAKPAADAKPAEGEKPAAETKPVDAEKPAEGEKPAAETKPAESAKPEPVEYKYTLPETLKLDDATKAELHAALDDFRADPAANAQKLIDLHNKSIEAFAKQVAQDQRTTFYATRDTWRKEIMADPILGGAGHQTAAGAVARMRDKLVDPADLKPRKFDDGAPRLSAFDEFLETTGAGDHPALWRMLHNAARYLDEPAPPPPNARPAANNGRRGPRRVRELYDHQRSGNGQG